MSVLIHPGRPDSPRLSSSVGLSRFPVKFLSVCFVTIAAISTLDTWFAVANSRIMDVEKNPICLALMELDPEGLTFFVAGKFLGTIAVLLTLLMLHRSSFRYAKLVTLSVALFQIGLLTFLTLSDPQLNNFPNFSLLFDASDGSIWMIE